MKQLIVLCGEHCGYCKKARMFIRRALEKQPELAALDIRYICDESPEAVSFPHAFVPAFFCDGEQLFEGNPTMDLIVAILQKCFKS
jgi:hypothetical protein